MDLQEIKGLTSHEASARQRKFGYNELPSKEKRNILKIIIELATEPMIALLLITVTIYFVLGDAGEASLLLLSVFGIIGIELYQETKTEKSLEALRNLSSPIADVIRDGKHLTVPGREVVVGDIIILSEGSRVPADAKLISSVNLQADESLLTGESMPVDKHIRKVSDYRVNSVFSGTLIVKGHGTAEVTSIGQQTEIGGIGTSLKSIETEKTLLQKEVTKVVKVIAVVAISASLVLIFGYWLVHGEFINGLLAGLTLAMSILPEEFPIVLILFLTLGAWRLARSNVLTRKAHTIETLGSASVLCVDKTGTLTQNKMKIISIAGQDGVVAKDFSQHHDVIKYGVLASQKKPFDPMEEAFIESGAAAYGSLDKIYGQYQLLKEYPLEEGMLSVAHVWGTNNVPKLVAIKGAPETVFELCKLSKAKYEKLMLSVNEMAHEGLRVLAVAEAPAPQQLPENRQNFDFTFLGLVGLADPIRKEVSAAVRTCKQAGIRVIMITGDYPDTAHHIGQQIGFEDGQVITGADFEHMTESERKQAIKNITIFSRVSPANKLTIVRALKENGEVVAMTGDGVNDAPALKAAHIGIAMGKKGTDVAREAATIVLLDDNFSSIVKGVRLGRRIYDNLQHAMTYLLAVHVPIAALSLAPVFFDWPLILLPVHIVFLEFIIDPSSTMIFENEKEDKHIMDRPPRKLTDRIFSAKIVASSLFQGAFIAAVTITIYAVLTSMGWDSDKARSVTFLALIVSNLTMILGVSGNKAISGILHRENKAMIIVLSVALVSLLAVFLVPFLREIFQFETLHFTETAIAILLGAASAIGIIPTRYLIGKIIESRQKNRRLS